MKIGAYIVVKNGSASICKVIRHHLDKQGFDVVIVVDNGSTDDTARKVRSLNDSRVLLRRTEPKTGHLQHIFSTLAARELFQKHTCDWVVPIDSDEFWHSPRWGTVRNALFHAKKNAVRTRKTIHGLSTSEYRFYETALDDPDEDNFLRRLLYYKLSKQKKVIMHRLGELLHEVTFGNHSADLKDGSIPPVFLETAADELVRFHYPHVNKKDLVKRTLDQVEGFLISSRGKWLAQDTESRLSAHFFQRYNLLKQGRLDAYYYKNLFLSGPQVSSCIEKGTLFCTNAMHAFYPPDSADR